MKQLKTFLVAAFLGTVAMHSTAQVTVIDYGYCGAGGAVSLYWTLYSDSTLTIYGSGAMMNCWEMIPPNGDIAPWKAYRSQIKTVIIGDSVNTIGGYAFGNCNNLTFVSIGNSVTVIYDDAFSGCIGLSTITIPNSVIIIRYSVFSGSGLTSVNIPNSVTTIGYGAFWGCSNLASVTIGNSVTTIEKYAFYDCINLSSLIVHAVTPPIVAYSVLGSAFNGVSDTTPVYVPCSSVSDYETAWTFFSNFIGFTSDTTFFYDTICPNTVYNGNDFSISNGAGAYFRSEKTAQDCDSVICLILTEYPQTPVTYYFASICENDTYTDSNFTNLIEAKIYYDTLETTNGCDSVVCLELVVNQNYITQIADSIFIGSSYNFAGKLLTESGIYYDTLVSVNTCDSIIELTLTVTGVGIVETGRAPSLQIYPNPTTGQLTINNEQLTIETIEIYNMVGQLVQSKIVNLQSKIDIDISHLHSGIYFIKINNITRKIIKF